MADIQRLPASVVNRIAAGEVIERPASVVKELVENALDACATRIDVAIEQGGLELVRVTDNGQGIAAEQLPLAVEPHATSKICTAEDLFRVGTLGFRGEALASIAEVSRLLIRSRAAGRDEGAELLIDGGMRVTASGNGSFPALAAGVVPCGCPVGTTVEVKNLFFNTPVRRKFLRTAQTEIGHITEAVTRLALAHPGVHFTLRHGGRELYDLPPAANWLDRIERFFGPDVTRHLVWVESRTAAGREGGDGLALFGFVGLPSLNRPNPRMQFLFANGRFIRDRALAHALAEAYRGLLLTGRHAVCFLCLEMPPDAVDVNVHPTKLEVRFQDGGRIYSLLLATLRTRFLSTDLTSKLQAPPAWQKQPGGEEAALSVPAERQAESAMDPRQADALRSELVAWAKGELGAEGGEEAPWERDDQAAGGTAAPAASPSTTLPRTGLQFHRVPESFQLRTLPPPPRTIPGSIAPGGPLPRAAAQSGSGPQPPIELGSPLVEAGAIPEPPVVRAGSDDQSSVLAMQVHDRYLIVESDAGVVVIDQHALHERILYEQLRSKVVSQRLESQSLLVSEPVDLSPAEADAVLAQRQVLAELGVRVEPFGGSTVVVTSYPAILARARVAELLRGIVERLLAGGKVEPRHLVDELLHMMACKAAIKAGDRLTPQEIMALLAQRHLVADAHHCPHGRPTALVLTREELDRQFLRT
ncbi:MAG: DNA mismatch repair endonuclease MutL [Planctomycetia bacterium]|nr:DNA mismatch repair endonuclease MutL [Planctomycetia bacterium]